MNSPLDRKAFKKRMDTYKVTNWGCKPTCLSPLVCASRGWKWLAADKIICSFCKCQINIVLPKRNKKFYDKLVSEYEEKLIILHKEQCIWRTVKCPEYFVTNEEPLMETLENQVENQSCELLRNGYNLLQTVNEKLQEMDVLSHNLIAYCSDRKLDPLALWLSHKGWTLRQLTSDQILACDICKKNLVIWKCLEKTGQELQSEFDQHLNWCPWINPVINDTSLQQRLLDHVNMSVLKKRKRTAEKYKCSENRKEEVKEIKRKLKDIGTIGSTLGTFDSQLHDNSDKMGSLHN